MESKQNKDVVIPISEARGLRDELSKLLADLHEINLALAKAKETQIIQVEVTGAPFK